MALVFVPSIDKGDLEKIHGSWYLPGPALVLVAIWGSERAGATSTFPLPLSLPVELWLSNKVADMNLVYVVLLEYQ